MENTNVEQKLVEFLESNEYIPPEAVFEVIKLLSDQEEVYWSEVFQTVQPFGKPNMSDPLIPNLGRYRIQLTNEILELFSNLRLITRIEKDTETVLDGELKHDTEPYVTTDLFGKTKEDCKRLLKNYGR